MAGSAKADSFKDFTTPYLECRHLNHSWRHQSAVVQRNGLVELNFRCTRCTGRRIDTYVRKTGELDSRRYEYPTKYLRSEAKKWGKRSVFNANVRVELIQRYTKK